MSKAEIRQSVLSKRKELPIEVVNEKSKRACEQLINRKEYASADVILSYMSIDGEIDLSMLNDDAMRKNKKVFIPKVLGKHHMEFYRFQSVDDLKKGKFGILEPNNDEVFNLDDVDLVKVLMIVPGVAYDKNNNRCGYGGGFYDNYLLRVKEKSYADNFYTIATCYDFQMVVTLEEGEYDQKIDEVLIVE